MRTRPSTKTRALAELLVSISARSNSRGFTEGLHSAQWEALRYFARANESARSVTAFAQARGTTQGTATQTVSALVRKGLLTRRPRPEDRRSACLDVTESGRECLKADPLHHVVEAVHQLTATEREALTTGLVAVLQNLKD